jgi:hypothetical protein
VGDCRNLDISTIPGVARINNITVKKSGTTVDALVLWMVKDPVTPANVYALDSNGVVYNSADSGVSWAELSDRAGSGQGMVIWKGYLFVATDTALDVYGPLASSPAWTTGWKTIDSDTAWHPMIVSFNDNKLYGGAGKYIFSLDENTGQTFAPGTAASFTFTAQALDLPPSYRIKCLTEIGNNLLIGTWMGTSIYDLRVADIFPWDRAASSFSGPVKLNVNGVHAMTTINNTVFVLAGVEGEIFVTNGVNAEKVAQIPSSVANIEGGLYLETYPGALLNYKGRPFFGVSGGGTGVVGGMGVWSLSITSQGNIITHEHTISEGTDGSVAVVKVGALCDITRDSLLIGWRSSSTYGIDKTTATVRYTSYGAYFESAFYQVGTPALPRKFEAIEVMLAAPLTTGQGIIIKYRSSLAASWTTLTTIDFATYGGFQTKRVNFSDDLFEFLQIRIELTTGASLNTTPQFRNALLS